MNILFICHGNIARSAFSEAWMESRPQVSQHCFASAGMGATPGRCMAKKIRNVAAVENLDSDVVANHKSQLFTLELAEWADQIVYMDKRNHRMLIDATASCMHLRSKFAPLYQWHTTEPEHQIDDPGFVSEHLPKFTEIMDRLRDCLSNYTTHLTLL